MDRVRLILISAACVVVFVVFLFVILWKILRGRRIPTETASTAADDDVFESLPIVTPRLHQVNPDEEQTGLWKADPPEKQFSWANYPALVADAVENGWQRFAFTASAFSPVSSGPSDPPVEIGWEVRDGSVDHMQRIRLNPGMKSEYSSASPTAAVSVIRAALPLPGPQLGNSAFPQEAYFEITVLPANDENQNGEKSEGDTIILISDESGIWSNTQNRRKSVDQLRGGGKKQAVRCHEQIFLSVGLTAGGPLQLRTPGSFPGSIGFNSNGSVYLDGTKLVFVSENSDYWQRSAEKVIGCGYDPAHQTVYFTANSHLVRVVSCKIEPFTSPLYPMIAANTDVTMIVNLGQASFKFDPANAQRTPNPCFIKPTPGTMRALGYEDSTELFSMGALDLHWRHRSDSRRSYRDHSITAAELHNNSSNSNNNITVQENFDDDLYEIALDRNSGMR